MVITSMLIKLKQAYDNAVQNAQNIINGTNQPTINKGDVSNATQSVKATKDALDGDHRLEEAKNHANQEITNLQNLNNAQKKLRKMQLTLHQHSNKFNKTYKLHKI